MKRRGKRVALCAVALGVAVLASTGIALRDHLREEWWLHKLERGTTEERERASGELSTLRPFHRIAGLVRLAKEAAREASRKNPSDRHPIADAFVEVPMLGWTLEPLLRAGGVAGVSAFFDGEDDAFVLKGMGFLGWLGTREHTPLLEECAAAAPALVPFLAASNGELRKKAVEILGFTGASAVAIPSLVNRLVGADEDLRASIVVALQTIGKPCLEPMIHALSHEDPMVRLVAVEVLDSLRESGAIPALVRALGDAHAEVRERACRALGNMGPQARAVTPALMRLFSDRDDAVRSQAAWAFWTLKEEAQQVVPVFMETVKARDMNTFRTSIWTLARIGPGATAAIPVLREMLQDKSCYRRLEAANALGEVEQDLSLLLPELMRALKCPCSDCRSTAPGILERLGARTSAMVRELIVNLKDGDMRTRERAARALGMIGPQAREAAGALREALKDPEPAVRNVAKDALKKIEEENS